MVKLTARQEEIYGFIAGYFVEKGESPTYQEIAMKIGTTTQMVENHIKNLKKKGLIKFSDKRNRKIELI